MLSEYGEMTKSRLISYCGLNMRQHKEILKDMEEKQLLMTTQHKWGHKTMTKYKVTSKGLEFFKMVLEPYENMFPRAKRGET